MQLQRTADDYTPYQLARHLEAYLLWLFDWVMFTSSHGDTVDARWIPHARAIADNELDEIPHLSWGSAVLCWTYRGLCQACIRKKPNSNMTGMPLLVNLWSYERFQVGRPYFQPEHYTAELYGAGMIDRPTMGSHWTRRRVRWLPNIFKIISVTNLIPLLIIRCHQFWNAEVNKLDRLHIK